MFPKNEMDLTDFYFLNDINVNNRMSSEELSALHDSFSLNAIPDDIIQISDASGEFNSVSYTYAKFIEILDTKGLEGLVSA